MSYLLLLTASLGFVSAGQPKHESACGTYFVVHHPQRVCILNALSAPRGLSASGCDLTLTSVLENLIGERSYPVRPAVRGQHYVDLVEFSKEAGASGFAVRTRWLAKDLLIREAVIGPRDLTLGDVTLNVRKLEDRSYEVTFGPNLRPLFDQDTVSPHVAVGPRQVLIWHFGTGGELRKIGLRQVTPEVRGIPADDWLAADVLNLPPIK